MSKNAWILEATWRIVDKRVSACPDPTKYQSIIQKLGRAIAAILKGDGEVGDGGEQREDACGGLQLG